MEIKRKLFVVLIGFLLKSSNVTANEFKPKGKYYTMSQKTQS